MISCESDHFFNQAEITAGGKRLSRAGYNDRVDVGIAVDIDPHVRHLGMGFRVHGIKGLRAVKSDAQDAIRRVVKFQFVVLCIALRHSSFPP